MLSTLNTPPYLKKGDKIAITCPAKKLPHDIHSAIALLESWGLEVVLGETVYASHYQFAGDDQLRTKDLQRFLDDAEIKAIVAARGGYGTIRIIDQVDFSLFSQNPKWLIGFSDITVLHSHIHNLNIPTIHGQMPLNVPDATKPSLESLRKALFGESLEYLLDPNTYNTLGEVTAPLIGGNLSLLVMMMGSVSEMDFKGKILFIEDVGEYLYAVDRMMWNLRRSGKLEGLAGLIVGGFTGIKDNDDPFGQNVEEIILNVAQEYHYPICFGFPAGHLSDNHAIIFGKNVYLNVSAESVQLRF
ncbi:S66 peptidase family protein [Desertivirga brevis]|uniref:S66 peptidase family protein n=1 Tax=Desertivirga brevis TaxID=2810310 RepID=UPI001A97656E|nr:LD-carboxypeptidase [Pedobacter sp. SYSU D00873]